MNSIFTKHWSSLFTRSGYPFFVLDIALHAYIEDMENRIGWGYKDQILFFKNGLATSYFSNEDKKRFQIFINNKDVSEVEVILQKIELAVNEQIKILSVYSQEGSEKNEFSEFLFLLVQAYNRIYSMYRFPTILDHLAKDIFPESLLYKAAVTKDLAGQFFDSTDKFLFPRVAKKMKEIFSLDTDQSNAMSYQEIASSVQSGILSVSLQELEDRQMASLLGAVDSKIFYSFGTDALEQEKNIVNSFQKQEDTAVLKGQAAFLGTVVGTVKIAFSVEDLKKISFEEPVILVTPMTTLQFVPFLKNVKGIVTDEGGITCHAAIVSRELGVPCVIGTRNATKILKDGDIVEVNANTGIIKKI